MKRYLCDNCGSMGYCIKVKTLYGDVLGCPECQRQVEPYEDGWTDDGITRK